MPFTIDFTSAAGTASICCETPLETLNKVLDLEQAPHGTITVKDDAGRPISFDELSALCVAGRD